MSSPPAPSAPAPEAPRPRERLSEVLAYRSLIDSYFRRQLRTRFLGSRLGWVWSLVNPLAMLAAYSIVFGVILGADRGMPPAASGIRLFAVFLFTGLVCWNIFVSVLTQTLDGLLELIPLRRKVAFPVLAPLLGLAGATLVERGVEVVLLLVVYAVLSTMSWTVLLVPVLMLLTAAFAFGLGMMLSVVNLKLRDIGHLIGVGLQLYFYATPIIYPAALVDEKFPDGHALRPWLVNNPMAAFVDAFRDVLWQLQPPPLSRWLTMLAWTVGALVVGWLWFRDRAYLVGEES